MTPPDKVDEPAASGTPGMVGDAPQADPAPAVPSPAGADGTGGRESSGTPAESGDSAASETSKTPDPAAEPEVDGPAAEDSKDAGGGEAAQDGLVSELPMEPEDDLSQVEDGDVSEGLVSILESLLFAASGPLTVRRIRQILKDPTVRQIQRGLKRLMAHYEGRGIVLQQVARGFRFGTRPDNAPYVQRLMAGKPARLSRSQLETLAVVAYRQPITKAEVDHVRGVDCSAVLRVLLERDLVKIVGRKEVPGRPHLYGTTVRFLEFFNLKSLRELPALREFEELAEEDVARVRERFPDGGNEDERAREAMGQTRLDLDAGETAAEQEAEGAAGRPSEPVDGSESTERVGSSEEAASPFDGDVGDGGASDAPDPAAAGPVVGDGERAGGPAEGDSAEIDRESSSPDEFQPSDQAEGRSVPTAEDAAPEVEGEPVDAVDAAVQDAAPDPGVESADMPEPREENP